MKFHTSSALSSKRIPVVAALSAALVIGMTASAFASSGLEAEAQLKPFSDFVLVWVAVILLSIAGIFVGLYWAFASRIGDAGQKAAMFLIGCVFVGGVGTATIGWLLAKFNITQGSIF